MQDFGCVFMWAGERLGLGLRLRGRGRTAAHGAFLPRVFSKLSQSVRNWDQSVVVRPAPMEAPRRLASVALPRAPSLETPSKYMFESGVRVVAVLSLALVEVRRAANMWVLSVREPSSGPRKSLEAATPAAPRSLLKPVPDNRAPLRRT